ncbi:S53 family peptidase [Streptomyces hygroscopicus]|uniref:S53 family peptidase n=1 Tax=Streptomyces hygroscopicus TaxID=1912 RepID=UPI00223FB323|nr:peptidase S8 [Streptomyces hygroscopicus]
MYHARPIRSLLVMALALVGPAALSAHAGTHISAVGLRRSTAVRVCPQPSDQSHTACLAMMRTDVKPVPSLPQGRNPAGLGPSDIRSAYNLFGRHGEGRTVAITVAFHDPHLESDLAVYRRRFSLPPCTKANGCLRVVNQRGGTVLPSAVDPVWSFEESIDVDTVSAACSDCHILVVENDSALFSDQIAGIDQAVALGTKFINSSWFVPETSIERDFDFHFSGHPGVAFTFASGDTGGVPVYRSVSPYVTSVGGTTLSRANNRRGWAETAWSGTGCGCSRYEPKPPFQHDTICPAKRTTVDVSAVADPATGLAVYDSVPINSGASGWFIAGGTSVSSPLLAAMYALAGNPAPGTYPNSYPYARPQAFNDIITGHAGPYSAGPGYDAPTGIGTPDGVDGLRPGS